MLTKALTHYRSRKDQISPVFVDPSDNSLLETSAELIEVFRNSPGQSLSELEDAASAVSDKQTKFFNGLKKLLTDLLTFEEDEQSTSVQRWEYLIEAQKLRIQMAEMKLSEYQGLVAETFCQTFTEIENRIYSDLPECKKILSFENIEPGALLHKYNCALVQFLLLQTHHVELRLDEIDAATLRRVFQKLKFHNLLATVTKDKQWVLQISGPLGIFENTQSYGSKLANFFPYVLHLPNWRLSAQVQYKNRPFTLNLTQKAGIQSHYSFTAAYIPEEYTAFIGGMAERQKSWTVEVASELINLGAGNYIFPDFTLRGPGGAVWHMELFHKWHKAEISQRLNCLANNPSACLILGVQESLLRNSELYKLIEKSQKLGLKVFGFKSFPTPRAVSDLLAGQIMPI
ncbi:MAG: DUF790 family protein [Oligoflexales bacterium]